MVGGGVARTSPIAAAARRHEAIAPQRFQSSFVGQEMNLGAALDGRRCGLETLQMNCQTAVSDGLSPSLNHGGSVGGDRPAAADGENEVSKPKSRSGGGVDREDCGLGCVDGNSVAKEGDSLPKDGGFPEDLDNNGVTAESDSLPKDGKFPADLDKPNNLPGFQYNGPAEEINLAVNNSGFMTSEATVPGCRKGRKAVVPWRFQIEYTPKWSQGGESPMADGENVVPKRRSGWGVDGEDCVMGGVDGNPAAKECDGEDCVMGGVDGNPAAKEGDSLPKDRGEFPEDLENNGVTADPHGTAKTSDLPDFQHNGPAEEINLKVNNSEGPMTSEGTVPGCRKGCKAVVPWRFQIGYKPRWSQGLSSGNRSNGEAEDPASKAGDPASRKLASAMAHNHSRLKSSATGVRSSVKVPKGTGSAPKKRKVDKDGQYPAMANSRISLIRENVLTTLREFRIIHRKLLEDGEIKWRARGPDLSPDIAAFNIFMERFCADNDNMKYAGSIPGVRVGDVFNSTMELSIVGIHREQSLPVDYIKKKDGTCLAVSVLSDAQPSTFESSDFLLHVGSVTATDDQKMEGTDVALMESMDTDTPVRVIHVLVTELGDDCRPKQLTSYVYGGLYWVEKFQKEKTKGNQYVNTFHLRRIAEQQHIDIQVLKTKKPESFIGTFIEDISGGLEKVPISAINSMSNEYLTTFHYISQIQYPLKYRPGPPSGCDCVGGCSVSQKCTCLVKNGGEFPFTNIGRNMEGKPLIYECGPSCKCPPTCHNRVSQHGIKFRLQVFKTKSMGWGVRTLDFIPNGSFVCEYVGELLEDEEAQKRKNDEYLFAIGNNYYDVPSWKAEIMAIPSLQNGPSEGDEVNLAVDALNEGNFARFINHCCTPNLFPQNVLHDHDDISMPHIMFFASEDIPPLKELSYDYNYQIDKVYDSDGNIKMKSCFCGSNECNGRLY